MSMTKEQAAEHGSRIERYINSGGNGCLYCGYHDIVGRNVDLTEGVAEQEITCGRCNATWIDVYELQHIREIDLPCQP